MFRLRKWKNFPYVTYLIGLAFFLLYVDWFSRQHLFDQSSSGATGVPEPLSAFFRRISALRGDMLPLGLLEVIAGLLLIGIMEILLVRWWAVRHPRGK